MIGRNVEGGPGGVTAPDNSLLPQWVRITGRLAGKNRYAYTQIDDGDAPEFARELGNAAAGTTAVRGYPAYELQGRTDVPVGAVVQVWPSAALWFQAFVYHGEGDTGEGSASSESSSMSGTGDDTDDDVTSGPVGGYCDTGCGSLAGLRPENDLLVEVACAAGEFRRMDLFQWAYMRHIGDGIWAAFDSDGDPFELNWVGGSGQVQFYFVEGRPALTLGGRKLMLRCADRDATFSGGWQTGHTGDGNLIPAPCKPNDFTLRVSCAGARVVVSSVVSSDGGADPVACVGKNYSADGATVTVSEKTGGATCLDTNPIGSGSGVDLVSWEDAGCGGFGFFGPRTMSCSGGFYTVTPGTGETWTFLGGTPSDMSWRVDYAAASPIGEGSAKVRITSP